MENFKLVQSGINVMPALTELASHKALWSLHSERQTTPGSPHVDTQTIVLLGPQDGLTADAAFNCLQTKEFEGWQALRECRILTSIVWDLVYAGRPGRVMVVKLKPGGFITPHADEGVYADTFERFHLSLDSLPGNVFYSETREGCGEFVHMRPGELWWFNHKRSHHVCNMSDLPRLHLIVDCVASAYRRERDGYAPSTISGPDL